MNKDITPFSKGFDQHAKRTWQRMLSGRRLNLIDPSPLDIEIEDIALGLARNTRWNGQTKGPHGWSVAQHSDFVTSIVQQQKPNAKAALLMAAQLHDAPEYVTHDLITPFKAIVGGIYKEVETRLMQAIHLRFGLPAILSEEMHLMIKKADKIAAATEAVQLAGFSPKEVVSILGIKEKPLPNTILIPVPVAHAEKQFLRNFRSIEASFQLQKRRFP
tara:strand:+ start:836 stop:1486 length:651 start_codon:yes stop_codon:yes gene_type:complete